MTTLGEEGIADKLFLDIKYVEREIFIREKSL
jgi:hypothetical protein